MHEIGVVHLTVVAPFSHSNKQCQMWPTLWRQEAIDCSTMWRHVGCLCLHMQSMSLQSIMQWCWKCIRMTNKKIILHCNLASSGCLSWLVSYPWCKHSITGSNLIKQGINSLRIWWLLSKFAKGITITLIPCVLSHVITYSKASMTLSKTHLSMLLPNGYLMWTQTMTTCPIEWLFPQSWCMWKWRHQITPTLFQPTFSSV